MKNSDSPSLSTLLFSAMLGALAVIIYRRLFKRPAPSVVPSQPLRIQMVKNPPEPCSPYQRRLPPLV